MARWSVVLRTLLGAGASLSAVLQSLGFGMELSSP